MADTFTTTIEWKNEDVAYSITRVEKPIAGWVVGFRPSHLGYDYVGYFSKTKICKLKVFTDVEYHGCDNAKLAAEDFKKSLMDDPSEKILTIYKDWMGKFSLSLQTNPQG